MKQLVLLVVLLLAIIGCESDNQVEISDLPNCQDVTEPTEQPKVEDRPVVTDIGKWPLFEDIEAGRPGWVVYYNVGLKSYVVRVPVKELTDEIVRDYVLKHFEKKQRLERDELEVREKFKGKKY